MKETLIDITKFLLIAVIFIFTVWFVLPTIIDWIVKLAIATVW